MNEREKVMVEENEVATTRGKKGIWTKPYFALLNSLSSSSWFVCLLLAITLSLSLTHTTASTSFHYFAPFASVHQSSSPIVLVVGIVLFLLFSKQHVLACVH
jgi:ABC-type tungstate transport system substrate-binding protein